MGIGYLEWGLVNWSEDQVTAIRRFVNAKTKIDSCYFWVMSKSGMGKFYSEKPSRYPGWWGALPYSKEQKTVSARLKLSSTTTFSQQEGIEQMTRVWDFHTKDAKVVRFASVHLPLVRTLATSSFKGLWLRSHVPMQGVFSTMECLSLP